MPEVESIVARGAWRLGLFVTCVTLVMAACMTQAHARQDAAPVKALVEDYLKVQIRGLPGEASYVVGSIDANNNLPQCTALTAFTPPNARPYGRTNVGVRCESEPRWQIYVPVQIRLVSEYLVTARPLTAGQPLGSGDLVVQRGDLGELPPGVITREEAALGQSLRMPVAAGLPLRGDLLKSEAAVQAGQNVKVVSKGAGFAVATEGQALNNAAVGQLARVRTGGGQTVSGVARAGGTVEINF